MSPLEPHPLQSKTVNIRRNAPQFGSERVYRVEAHVIDGQQNDIRPPGPALRNGISRLSEDRTGWNQAGKPDQIATGRLLSRCISNH
jgi:hypothetical protein